MSTSPEQKREHCDDLLVMSAVHGVDDAEQLELDRLIREFDLSDTCLLYTSPSPRDRTRSRMPSSA